MADLTTETAAADAQLAADKKKKMIKIAIIAVVVIVVAYFVWKHVLKK